MCVCENRLVCDKASVISIPLSLSFFHNVRNLKAISSDISLQMKKLVEPKVLSLQNEYKMRARPPPEPQEQQRIFEYTLDND